MAQSQLTTQQPIIFYSKTGCPWCNAVRHLFSQQGVRHEERNVTENPQFMAELQRQTNQDQTPTLRIGNEWLVDTDAKEAARQLGLPEPTEVRMVA